MAAELRLQNRRTPVTLIVPPGEFRPEDQPLAIQTPLGLAYSNTATHVLFLQAFNGNHTAFNKVQAALTAQHLRLDNLPEPLRTIQRLKRELLKDKPLWRDILTCKRLGLSQAMSARLCGCHPSTIRKHTKLMEESGILGGPQHTRQALIDMMCVPQVEA